MKRSAILAAIAAAALILGGPAMGQTPAPAAAAKPAKVLMYISQADIDPNNVLTPPPADGSPQAVAELAELHRVTSTRTAERYAQAKWDDMHEDPSAFDATIGPGFDYTKEPATAEVLRIALMDTDIAATAAKAKYARKRPWAVDSTIPTCDPDDKPLTSYPSGHATMGWTTAMVYADLMPEMSQDLMARAEDYGYSREVCGAHFPSDTQASRALAAWVLTDLMKNPEFQAKMQAARAELRAAKVATR